MSELEYAPPEDEGEVDALLARMVENGFEDDASAIEAVRSYRIKTCVESE